MNNLRSYLCDKYDDRVNINPQVFEDIVAGVFSDFGYAVTVTSHSGD